MVEPLPWSKIEDNTGALMLSMSVMQNASVYASMAYSPQNWWSISIRNRSKLYSDIAVSQPLDVLTTITV